MNSLLQFALSALFAFNLTACQKMTPQDSLPRHQALKTFDPHRKDFTCVYEADAVPPIDPEADAWHLQALYLTRAELWPDKKDWKQAERLWTQAVERKHWKAMMNLASLYETGNGEGALAVARDSFKAALIVEDAMKLGIPAAYDKMGNYHAGYIGDVRHDSSRAWAFWERAADMGNPQALTHIGKALSGTYDNPEEGFWGNRNVALPMLECAVAQGFGEAALVLGVTLEGTDSSIGENNLRALQVLQEGVKFGSEKSANYLGSSFRSGDVIVGNAKDPSRSKRYDALGDALYRNPDLRFPNLDKVLPLPPASLPQWDGQPQSLIDAAKAVSPVPAPVVTPGANRTGRAHIPPGYVLPTHPVAPGITMANGAVYMPAYERAPVRYTGYWFPQLLDPRREQHVEWNDAQVPLHYFLGDVFEPHRVGLMEGDGRVMWNFVGLPQRVAKRARSWRVQAGLLREIPALEGNPITCSAGKNCPRTGIWRPVAAADHPQVRLVNQWWRQAFIEEGVQMPDARKWGMAGVGRIVWHLLEKEG